MIYVGIDDTDTAASRGTNQLARSLVERVAVQYRCVHIVRHQLLDDPRVPYTSKNGSASIVFLPMEGHSSDALIAELRAGIQASFVEGSDPGLCATEHVPDDVIAFGRRCQNELVRPDEARELAARFGIHLQGLGGTEDGVIGALAAVGLIVDKCDGRLVQIGTWPDDLSGAQDLASLQSRDVEVLCLETGEQVTAGTVDVGKHLRPNFRDGRIVLFVRRHEVQGPQSTTWQAVRFT